MKKKINDVCKIISEKINSDLLNEILCLFSFLPTSFDKTTPRLHLRLKIYDTHKHNDKNTNTNNNL